MTKPLAFRILHNREDAEESENDTYFRTWNAVPPQRPRKLFGYLAKICRGIALDKLDWLNARKRRAEVVALTDELASCIPDNTADLVLEAWEIGELMNGFLASLSRENRLIFERRYVLLNSVEEIARYYGISAGKVKSSLFRTRNRLRTYLEQEGVSV